MEMELFLFVGMGPSVANYMVQQNASPSDSPDSRRRGARVRKAPRPDAACSAAAAQETPGRDVPLPGPPT